MIPRRSRLLLLAVLAVAVAGAFAWHRLHGGDASLIASGTVEATEAELGFPIAGRLESVTVEEGAAVRRGALIARLDQAELLARKAESAARLAAARAALLEARRGSRPEEIRQARAARDAAADRLAGAARDLERATALHQQGLISQEAFDKAALAHEVAKSQAAEVREGHRLAVLGPRRERVQAQEAAVAGAEATLAQIDAAIGNATILAPFDGLVTAKHREPGEIVPAGTPVVTLLDRNDRWVRIYVPEGRLGSVRVGALARIVTDSDPDRPIPGEVVTIASEAEFTPRSVQTREERVRLVYAVKVRIVGDPEHRLKPGMPADVRLDAK